MIWDGLLEDHLPFTQPRLVMHLRKDLLLQRAAVAALSRLEDKTMLFLRALLLVEPFTFGAAWAQTPVHTVPAGLTCPAMSSSG
jgi:hypothetical protein